MSNISKATGNPGSLLWRLRLSQAILLLCIILSFGGIYWAIHVTKCDTDAGRGGVIAVALALGVIVLDRSYALRLFNIIADSSSSSAEPVDSAVVRNIVREEIRTALGLLESDAKKLRQQNIYLVLATSLGTLSSGFGDLIVRYFIGHHCS